MGRQDFYIILKKYLQGKASPAERKLIDEWYGEMEKAQRPFSGNDELRLEDHYWARIKSHITSERSSGAGALWICSAGVAASVLVILLSYLNIAKSSSAPAGLRSGMEKTHIVLERIENTGVVPESISLPDGSQVTLEPMSTIKYASEFSGPERKVYLDGKAFFDVVPDKNKPFRVHTRKVITKVLGTSFMVSAFHWQKDVMVEVRSGKVSVIPRNDYQQSQSEIILTPNQQFIYDTDKQRMFTGIVKEPTTVLPADEIKRMRFEETSPKLVFEAIEKAYGVDIVFDENRFSSCRITTSISDGNIFNRLRIICELINASYRVEEGKIIIEGEGCYANL